MKKVELVCNNQSYDSVSHVGRVLKELDDILEANPGKQFLLTLEEVETID